MISDSATDKAALVKKLLLDGSGTDVYRQNAFRVLGRAIDAKDGQTTSSAKNAKLAALGIQKAKTLTACLPLNPAPDQSQELAAEQRLKHPVWRLTDEVLWFWPHGRASEGVAMLACGDISAAQSIWQQQEREGAGLTATHNLAVLFHVRALESGAGGEDASKSLDPWEEASARWYKLSQDEKFWILVDERAKAIADPMLSPGAMRSFRDVFPEAIVRTHARWALRAAETDAASARACLAAARDAGWPADLIDECAHEALEPLRESLTHACDAAVQSATAEPKAADKHCRDLLERARTGLALIDALLAADDDVRLAMHDTVADKAFRCQVVHGKETQDWKTSLSLLEAVLAIAAGTDRRGFIEGQIKVVEGLLAESLCFYCQERPGNDKHTIKQDMHGDITHPGFGKIAYRHACVQIPCCTECGEHRVQKERSRQGRLALFLVALLPLGLTGILTAIALDPQERDWEPAALFACVTGLVAVALVCLAVHHGIRHRRLPAFRPLIEHPRIAELVKRSWAAGKEPAVTELEKQTQRNLDAALRRGL